jgi:hypothetical protein
MIVAYSDMLVALLHVATCNETFCTVNTSGGQTVDHDLPVDRGQLFGRSRPLFFKIAYLNHN